MISVPVAGLGRVDVCLPPLKHARFSLVPQSLPAPHSLLSTQLSSPAFFLSLPSSPASPHSSLLTPPPYLHLLILHPSSSLPTLPSLLPSFFYLFSLKTSPPYLPFICLPHFTLLSFKIFSFLPHHLSSLSLSEFCVVCSSWVFSMPHMWTREVSMTGEDGHGVVKPRHCSFHSVPGLYPWSTVFSSAHSVGAVGTFKGR